MPSSTSRGDNKFPASPTSTSEQEDSFDDGASVTIEEAQVTGKRWRGTSLKLPGTDIREECCDKARMARAAFDVACKSLEPDQADASYQAAVDGIDELWQYAQYRAQPFRDL